MVDDVEEPVRGHRVAQLYSKLSAAFRSAYLRKIENRKVGILHCEE